MPPNNKKSSNKKKGSSNNNNNYNNISSSNAMPRPNAAGHFGPGNTGHGVVDEGPLEFYSEPTEHRQVPSMSMDQDSMKRSVLSLSNPSATAKRFARAYQLVESMEAGAELLRCRYGADGNQGDICIDVLKRDRDYIKHCVSLIQANVLTDQRVGVSAFIYHKFPLPSCRNAVRWLAPLEGKDSKIQLGNLNSESFVIMLATAIVLAMTTSPHPCLRILHELRIHAVGNFAELTWKELEMMELDSLATEPTEASLRFALGMVGVKMARRLYRQRDDRQASPFSKPLTTKVLLDSIETFARDQCTFRPTSGAGFWNLGWLAQQSVAKRGVHPLEGAAEMLGLMKQCIAVADVEDDDFLKAGARIEAAMCMVLGADGIVGYTVLGKEQGQAQRDMRSDKSRSAQQVAEDVTILPLRVFGETDEIRYACVEYEKRRMSTGVPATEIESGEKLIVPRWEVLKLWNEAMVSYDSIKRWGYECFVYGEVGGWDLVVDFLQRTNKNRVGQYASAPLVPGFPSARDKGHGESYNTGCAFCGKTDGKSIMKCSRCKAASYCSKDCQKGDWKKHKAVCKLLEK
jgi:hypothetical protein